MTKDSELVLAEIYKQYLEKQNLDNPCATEFDSSFSETCDVFGESMPNTVDRCLEELHKLHFISMDINGDFELLSDGIEYMDYRLSRKIDKITEYISRLKP